MVLTIIYFVHTTLYFLKSWSIIIHVYCGGRIESWILIFLFDSIAKTGSSMIEIYYVNTNIDV
jgi:ABC-type maltose transport system permease subunit